MDPRLSSYQRFLTDHLIPNAPCVFSSELTTSWACHRTFLTPSRSINRDHLLSLQRSSPISLHRPLTSAELKDQEEEPGTTVCEPESLQTVLDAWKEGNGEGFYIKDWHLALEIEQLEGRSLEGIEHAFYHTPPVFLDDWLNGFYRSRLANDFRFVYLGAPNTTTLLHRDVYSSYSFSTNILGRKKWHLYPPSHAHLLRRYPRELRSELIKDVRQVDEERFKGWEEVKALEITIVQEEGETVFVPSGWYHQVENLQDPTSPNAPILSINHNWANSTNIVSIFETLCNDIQACEEAISDIKDLLRTRARQLGQGEEDQSWKAEWVDEVQALCERDSGWGWKGFWEMVEWGVEHALDPTVRDVQPPLTFIHTQVNICISRYENERPEAEFLPTVREVVEKVKKRLVVEFSELEGRVELGAGNVIP